ncbi:hypothetical protein BFR75_02585 [Acinetobacter pittii]|uniref:polymorphic toxin-type HINT domain-containing protein n=1 Tax=Acinetobacter pittii TaxID=48296 RepID=UPI00083945C4|nr:polymorphic toxin-type HINT domain-containing protein [Acinetobacter pittii]OCY34606.1 hypothetical protein BFR75_02585 [Acinetobacter pittii]
MKYKLLVLSILMAMQQAHTAELEIAGSLEGNASVDSLGVIDYSIPLSIPPSINGFIPQLAITYNGQSPDGILGTGWGVSGLSSIVRCNNTKDNQIITPYLAVADELKNSSSGALTPAFDSSCFALNGKKLILVSSSSSFEKAEFRFENDNFTKITVEIEKDSSGKYKGIKKFIVKQKDGVVSEYATTLKTNRKDAITGGYVEANDSYTYEWGLSSVKDINGNYWTVEYQDLNKGILYPKNIQYTGNSGEAPVLPTNIVNFEYVSRSQAEVKTGFSDMSSNIVLDKKLSKIIIKSNNVTKSEYRLQYEEINDQLANKTRLKNINYCTFSQSDQLCLSPINLNWSTYGKDLMTTPLRDTIIKIPDVKLEDSINTVRMNTKKGGTTKESIFIVKTGNNLKLNSTPVDLMGSAFIDTTLNHESLSSFQQWSPITMDVNGDGIEDLVIYGRNAEQQVSLLLFTSSFNLDNVRQFTFFKEFKNILSNPGVLLNIRTIDGDKDGVDDLVILSGDRASVSDIRFDGVKLNIQDNTVSTKTVVIGASIRDAIRKSGYKPGGTLLVDRILSGNFRRDKTQDIVFYYTNSSGLNLCSVSVYKDIIKSSKADADCENTTKVIVSGAQGEAYKDYDFNVVDFNGDGLDDIIMSKVIRLDAADGPATRFHERLVPLLSTGSGFEIQPAIDLPIFTLNAGSGWIGTHWEQQFSTPSFVDFNHDGSIDFYRYVIAFDNSGSDGKERFKSDLISYLQRPNKKFDIYQTNLSNWWAPYSAIDEINFRIMGWPSDITRDNYNVERVPVFSDINNNGFQEINFQFIARPKTGTGLYIYSFLTQAAQKDIIPLSTMSPGMVWTQLHYPNIDFQDMLKSVESGDGLKQQFEYTNYSQAPESQEAKPFPIRATSAPILVTSSVESYLNAIKGSKVYYNYSSPRADVKENRFLGFETVKEISESYNKNANGSDITNKLTKETIYNQNYPFVGMPKTVVMKANDVLVSKMSVSDTDFISDSAYPSTKVKFPRIKKSTVENYDLGKLISTTVTTDNYENIFGNLIDSTVTTTSADNKAIFSTQVKPTYSAHDRTNWIPGLVKERLVSSTRTGQPVIQKKTLFDYDVKQRLVQKIDEPDDLNLKLKTYYSYDNYGNINKVTISGAGNSTDTNIGTRVLSSAYEAGVGYPAGVFKTKEVNSLSQESTSTYDATTGQMLSSTDINGVTSKQTVDSLGRIKSSSPAGAAQTNNDYQLCKTFVELGSNSKDCEVGENYKTTSVTTLNAPVVTFKDARGNVKRVMTKAYDNNNDIVVRNEYDPSGRLYRSSVPSLSNVAYTSLQWTSYEYDVLGRIVKLIEPGNRITSYTYDGLQSTMTNAKGLKRTEKKNIANEVVEILDHDNNSLKYTRDALGRLIQTTDALGNSIVITLDNNGNKLQQVDPVLGTWKYRYNPLGQPVWQQDAKGQETKFQYDVLGRLKQRVESDLTSTWTWDSASTGKGKLAQVSSTNGFSENYAYDSFGRLYQTTTSKKIDPHAQAVTDSDFITKWNFDAAGRILAFAYPTGFGYRNIYDTNGYLKEVRNLAGNQLYWAANERDARGNITQETFGNGLETKKGYKADTGFLESINTGNAKIQQNTYSFDVIGNLNNRNQNLAGISINETFTYDNINRLKTVTNQKGEKSSVDYDVIGNIISRSGKETFNSAKSNSYTWTSFNMPSQIKQGTIIENFMYDANHERVRRTSITGGDTTTTVYLNPRIDTGGTFEKTYLPNGTAEYTHYIYANGNVIGSYVTKDKGTPPTGDLGLGYQNGVVPNSAVATINKSGPYRYFHTDHLNSIEVITDASGNPLERLSYDPWGKRRNVDGTVSSTPLKGLENRHGFTSHEMLDSIGLVHMNGRIYDPNIGRFISADPTIDGSDNLQGYNRYSYVHNNPGTLLDPSGYSWLSKKWKSFTGFLEDALVTVTDDWLGSCSGSQGNCGVTVGVTYGPNNQGIGSQNDGRNTVQPYIGFGGSVNHDDYTFHFTYDSNGLTFDKFYYPQQYALPGSNYIDIATLRAAFDFSYSVDDYITYFDMPQDISAKLRAGPYGSDEDKAARRAWLAYELGDGIAAYGAYTEINPLAGLGNRKYLANKASSYLKSLYPCGCFDNDTPVLTKDGYKRIVEIKEGDLVLARHEETGEIAYKPVKRVFVVPNRRIYLLKTINNFGKESIIEVSDDHPFWVVDKKWVNSIDLEEGDQLLDANNQLHKVVSIKETDRVETTYNLEVEGYHTYFAGDANIWVHNAGPCALNMKSFLNSGTDFSESLNNSLQKTAKRYQGQSVYKVNTEVNSYITKGDQLYLDGLHKDHFEVFDKQGRFKAVVNLDGSYNSSKSKAAVGRKLK